MAASYYSAGTENRDYMEDPREDGLFTFIAITGADEDPAWYASATLFDYGTFEVERNGTCTVNTTSASRPGPTTSPQPHHLPSRRELPWPARQKINPWHLKQALN